ncbi:hypothetical protein NIES4071_25620 [Calothrix sp. NIES-4071]|nr:hypothetical protein NIES4071_25620 [Calothrix sp. NIES-4071]BAZ56885.1 hypothetical protein NIES4105_25560 [Calothrix sp. NIES-4105]
MKKIYALSKTLLISVIVIIGLNPQQTVQSQQNNQTVRFVQPILRRPPINRGAPTDRRGAGTRGECPAVSMASTGLVPIVSSNNSKYVIGNTATEYPTFWFYIPYNAQNINSVKFAVIDDKDQSLTKEPIPVNISGTPGIISFTLPKTEQPLKPGQDYHWYLLIDCNPQSRSEDVAIEGLVRLEPPDAEFKKRLEVATEREKAALYAQQGYWYDTITTLGILRRQQPKDTTLIEDWKTLLNSQELTDIAAEPISPCCISN